jgi:hypothetical protein
MKTVKTILIVLTSLLVSCNKNETKVDASTNLAQSPSFTSQQPGTSTDLIHSGDTVNFFLSDGTSIEFSEFTFTDSTQCIATDSLTFILCFGDADLEYWATPAIADPQSLADCKSWVRDALSELNAFYAEVENLNIAEDDDEAKTNLYNEMYPGRLTGRAMAIGACYKNTNFSGGFLPVFHYPNLSPLGWNNQITSWWGGGIMLADYSWWGGTRLWWWGPGRWNGTSIYNYMNDRTTSILSY